MFGYKINTLESIIIWGAGGHAKSVADAIEQEGKYLIEGFVDDLNINKEDCFYGRRLFNDFSLVKANHLVMAIGDNKSRMGLYKKVNRNRFNLPNILHPSAVISRTSKVGRGSVILAGSILNADCVIGECCIVNTGASIDHDCVLEDGGTIAPGCHLAGYVKIGKKSWIGIGSCVREKIIIGSNSFIGAGSVVVKDIPDNVLAYGNPCKIIKKI